MGGPDPARSRPGQAPAAGGGEETVRSQGREEEGDRREKRGQGGASRADFGTAMGRRRRSDGGCRRRRPAGTTRGRGGRRRAVPPGRHRERRGRGGTMPLSRALNYSTNFRLVDLAARACLKRHPAASACTETRWTWAPAIHRRCWLLVRPPRRLRPRRGQGRLLPGQGHGRFDIFLSLSSYINI